MDAAEDSTFLAGKYKLSRYSAQANAASLTYERSLQYIRPDVGGREEHGDKIRWIR